MRRLILPLITLSCLAAASPASAQNLVAAITDALTNAPTLAEANAGEAAAKARLDRARAESNPLLRIEGSYGAGRIDNGGFFGIAPANVNPLAMQAVAALRGRSHLFGNRSGAGRRGHGALWG
jgi:outer membrane protein